MITTRTLALAAVVLLAACGGGNRPDTTPQASSQRASEEQLDSLWQRASTKLAEEEWNDAAILFERLMLELPRRDSRLPRARLGLGDARLGQKSFLQAVREYRRTADDYPTDSLAPAGLLRAGDAYARLWRRPELDPTYGTQAMATWQELLTRYPQSSFADSARARIDGLNEWFAVKALKAGEFYLRYKAYDSAIIYLSDMVVRYPQTAVAPVAMVQLINAYRRLGYEEDVAEKCGYFRLNYPDAELLDETCPATATPGAATLPDS